jgi:AcrR family transcriptional regulator
MSSNPKATPAASSRLAEASRSDARRAQILEAAHTESIQAGLASVRMEAIAARAHVSKGTLYNHFASKEDLLLAMVVDHLRSGEQIVNEEMGAPDDPRAALDGMLRGLATMLGAQSGSAPLLFQAWSLVAYEPSLRGRLDASLRALFRSWGEQTRVILEDGQRAGVFDREVDASALADAISGLVSGFLFRASFDPERANPDTLLAAFREVVSRRLLLDQPAPRTKGTR